MAIDWTNPCAKAAALRDAYYRALGGQAEIEIETRTPEGEQRVKFARTDLATLKSAMEAAEDDCLRANGQTPKPRRHAISAGAVRRPGFWGY